MRTELFKHRNYDVSLVTEVDDIAIISIPGLGFTLLRFNALNFSSQPTRYIEFFQQLDGCSKILVIRLRGYKYCPLHTRLNIVDVMS